MTGTRLKVRVPGKLMVAGEYAVLEPDHEAIVIAVDRYVTATIFLSPANRLYLHGMDLNNISWQFVGAAIEFSIPDTRLRYIERALCVTFAYLQSLGIDIVPFSLRIQSELDDPDGHKYGLGSSAAVVVAVVFAVLNLFGQERTMPEVIFKLSAIAHFEAQGSGSGADVAASTFGGWLRYASFKFDWLSFCLSHQMPVAKLIREPWPHFRAERIQPPTLLQLCVGWTGEPAATAPLVKKVSDLKKRSLAEYEFFLKNSAAAVSNLVCAFATGNIALALEAFEQNRVALYQLGKEAGVPIETPQLRELHRIAKLFDGAGKPSGAGGGDCGIALVKGDTHVEHLYRAWRDVGIEPLHIQVSSQGVHRIDD